MKRLVLKGQKVILRAIEVDDAEFLREMINSPEIEKMVIGYSFPVSKDKQLEWIKNQMNRTDVFRAVIEVENTAIGEIMLTDIDMKNGNAEIHIKILNNEFKNKGYGTDSVNTLVSYAFDELRLNCIHCTVREDNIASNKLFKKCGFSYEGTLRNRLFKEGNFYSLISYSKTIDYEC